MKLLLLVYNSFISKLDKTGCFMKGFVAFCIRE